VLPANTPAWTFQVWTAFVLSLLVLTRGIYEAEVQPWARGFMMIACMFTILSSFTLSKTLRDNLQTAYDTPAWIFLTWASFVVSLLATFSGVYWLPAAMLNPDKGGQGWVEGFFVAAFLFLVNSSFALSKTVRDNADAAKRAVARRAP
jgi:hypothetical protein